MSSTVWIDFVFTFLKLYDKVLLHIWYENRFYNFWQHSLQLFIYIYIYIYIYIIILNIIMWISKLSELTNLFVIVVTEIHGRTFGTWTLLTCTLCYICAFNLENKPLYLATFLSFIYALGHFLTEYLIYHTMEIKNLTTVGIFAGMILFSRALSNWDGLNYLSLLCFICQLYFYNHASRV